MRSRRCRGDRRLAERARHLLDARPLVDAGSAARCALRAGRQAMRTLAYEDAADLLERAADGDLDESDPLRTEVLLALAERHQRLGDATAARRCLDEAARLARALGDGELLARAALGAAGLTVTVGPVREEVRALLEEALDAVARTPSCARGCSRGWRSRSTTSRRRRCASSLSDEALARRTAQRRRGRCSRRSAPGTSPSGARRTPRSAWPSRTSWCAAAQRGGRARGGAAGRQLARGRPVRARRARALCAAIADHERLAAELRLPGYDWYVPMWRAALALLGHAAGGGGAAPGGGRADRAARAGRQRRAALRGSAPRRSTAPPGACPTRRTTAIRSRAEHSPARRRLARLRCALRRSRAATRRARARALAGEVAALAARRSTPTGSTRRPASARSARTARRRARGRRALPAAAPLRRADRDGRRAAATASGSASLALGLLAATLGDRAAAVGHLEAAVRAQRRVRRRGLRRGGARRARRAATRRGPRRRRRPTRLLWRL